MDRCRAAVLAGLALLGCNRDRAPDVSPSEPAAQIVGDCAVSAAGLECLGVSSYAADIGTARGEAVARALDAMAGAIAGLAVRTGGSAAEPAALKAAARATITRVLGTPQRVHRWHWEEYSAIDGDATEFRAWAWLLLSTEDQASIAAAVAR